jgi:hypothetical protein
MDHGHGPQRLTPEQRRRIEEEEERREAEYAAETARQRELLQQTEADGYVSRRMQREMETIEAENRQAEEAQLLQSGGVRANNTRTLLLLGLLLSALLLGFIFYVAGRHAP